LLQQNPGGESHWLTLAATARRDNVARRADKVRQKGGTAMQEPERVGFCWSRLRDQDAEYQTFGHSVQGRV